MCTCCEFGVVYMWSYVHVVLVMLCTCGTCAAMYIMHMLYCVHVVHVMYCTCGIVLCALFSHCIVTCVFVVLYTVYVYVLCYTLGVGVCVVLYVGCKCMYCVV